MTTQFDAKIFNEEAFGKYMNAIPDVKRNKLLESGAITKDQRLLDLFGNQTNTAYGIIPFYGNLEGDPDNYDGKTDVTTSTTTTFEQGVFTFGRMHGWTEKDFSYEITGGVDFMANVRTKIMKFWNDKDQDSILAILKGIYSMTGAKNTEFITMHTNDISAKDGDAAKVGPTSLNDTVQKACGDNKEIFTLAIMHSTVSTNLENLKLIAYLKYTDASGVERDLGMGTWNGKLVIIDDSMPTEIVPAREAQGTEGEEGYVPATEEYTKYTTYVLGDKAISFQPLSVKHPYEMVREAKVNGGEDTLISRKRTAVAVSGISYLKKQQASLSPTNEEMADGKNWSLVNDSSAGGSKYISHKAIPIARIISRG